jgi:trehalose-6-phosphate synthase
VAALPHGAYTSHLPCFGLGILQQSECAIRRRTGRRNGRRGTSCHPDQDYHFALLPRMMKDRMPHARVAIFCHIPWPNPEAFSICPWQQELLDGLLGADLIGFHVQAHCNNFLSTIDRVLEARVNWEHFSVKRKDHWSSVLPFPISVEFLEPAEAPQKNVAAAQRSALIAELGIEASFVGVGVDRVDYTKGIIERFQAVEAFLESHPRYQEKITLSRSARPHALTFRAMPIFNARSRPRPTVSMSASNTANGGRLSF